MDVLGLWPRGKESKCLEDERMKPNILGLCMWGCNQNTVQQ